MDSSDAGSDIEGDFGPPPSNPKSEPMDTTDNNKLDMSFNLEMGLEEEPPYYLGDPSDLFLPPSEAEVTYLPLTLEEQGLKKEDREKKTFHCELCDIVLSSVDTLNSHVQGVRHQKMESEYESERERVGYDNVEPKQVRQIKNPEPVRKKIPVRLQAKIKESARPVLGLSLVDEFIAASDPEMEPHYICNLCGTRGEANCMFNHVSQVNHQRAFFEKKFPDDPKYVDLPRTVLTELASHFSENDRLYLINNYTSDLLFPNWIDGKAPWSLEQGGTGIVPDEAREKVDSRITAGHPEWRKLAENQRRAFMALKAHVPGTESVKEIKTDADTELYSQFLLSMLDKVCDAPALFENISGGDEKTVKLREAIEVKKKEIAATLMGLEIMHLGNGGEQVEMLAKRVKMEKK